MVTETQEISYALFQFFLESSKLYIFRNNNKAGQRGVGAIDHIEIDGRPVPLHVRVNQRARRIILRIHPKTSDLIVTVPSRAQVEDALRYVWSQSNWLEQTYASLPDNCSLAAGSVIPYRDVIHRIKNFAEARRGVWIEEELSVGGEPVICVSGQSQHTRRRVRDWLRLQAKTALRERSDFYSTQLNLTPAKIILRDTHSRWGSCSSTGLLSFSWRLVMAPDYVLDYVAAHETAHRVQMNHSAKFWALVDAMTCSREKAELWLKHEGPKLFLYK